MDLTELIKKILLPFRKPEPIPEPPPIPMRPFDIPKPEAVIVPIGSAYKDQVETYRTAVITQYRRCYLVTLAALRGRDRYLKVSEKTGVPWFVIAGIHRMESDQHWKACLHNGEKIIGTGKKTTLVPSGCGPFPTWEDAAIDALKREWLPSEWSLGSILEFCERYNGLGYRKRGIKSPYVYGLTTAYTKGHFVRDGHFDAEAIHNRPGIASMMKCLEDLGQIQIV